MDLDRRRIDVPGFPYHVFSRGNDRQAIYRSDDDRRVFLKMLEGSRKKATWRLHSFVLMDNHFHLLAQLEEGSSLAGWMKYLLAGYAIYFNRKYRHLGHVFQGRYHANLVEQDRYFLAVDRYIHLNPVHAGMVQKPEDYPWSSYSFRLKQAEKPWMDGAPVLAYFGGVNPAAIQKYRRFTEEGIPRREAWTHKELKRTRFLGSPEFIETVKNRII